MCSVSLYLETVGWKDFLLRPYQLDNPSTPMSTDIVMTFFTSLEIHYL